VLTGFSQGAWTGWRAYNVSPRRCHSAGGQTGPNLSGDLYGIW